MEMRILQGSNVLRKAAWKQGGQRSIYFWGICTIPIPLISFGLQRENQDARALLGVPLSIKYILKRRPFMWTLDSKREKVAGGFTGLRAGNRWQVSHRHAAAHVKLLPMSHSGRGAANG
ncbi:hypothetical protein GGX14DRAFT_404880 [Mycena pura]|uniref:Uncharacterized protein n=1 Tax=Mycena pura TaxID=153505 RepID=A0AAD6XZP7_9AGAR|nr:hypothetical protein GGX14DRAFT_404880 [Mycena pura]